MKRFILLILTLLLFSRAEAGKEWAMEHPSGTPLEVYTPNNPPTETDPLSLHLDQTTPQNITGGQPDFLAGLRAGSTNQLSIDASGNVLTTGTLGAGAITGSSFIIGSYTLSSFANLYSLSGLSWSSGSPLVKMTAAGTFGLDTTAYLSTLTTSTPTNLTGFIKGNGSVLSADNSTYLSLAGGTMTGAVIASDHGTASTAQVVNVVYGTSATPPTASTTTEGTIYIKYTP